MRETKIIVDTSALVAFFIRSEKHHQAARQIVQTHPHMQWIILNTVFLEAVTWVRAKVSISHSIQIGQLLRDEHEFYCLSAADEEATWKVFSQYHDKQWSYVDCSILAMSQRLGVGQVFAFDAHFNQMSGLNLRCIPNRF